MTESEVLSLHKKHKKLFDSLIPPEVDIKKIAVFVTEILNKKKKGALKHTLEKLSKEISSTEFIAVILFTAIVSDEKDELELCGEAYEVLMYLTLKNEGISQALRFMYDSFKIMPIEVLHGVLRGLASYDLTTKSNLGKELLTSALAGTSLQEIEQNARQITFLRKIRKFINIIKMPLLGAILGIILGTLTAIAIMKIVYTIIDLLVRG